MKKPMIEIYAYHDAPDALRLLANQGGDEDWIVVLNESDPKGIAEGIADKLAICEHTTIFDSGNNRLLYVCTHA